MEIGVEKKKLSPFSPKRGRRGIQNTLGGKSLSEGQVHVQVVHRAGGSVDRERHAPDEARADAVGRRADHAEHVEPDVTGMDGIGLPLAERESAAERQGEGGEEDVA